MIGRRNAAASRDIFEEVPVGKYLAARRPVPHLFEVGPDDLRGRENDAAALASLVRVKGDKETDVCLLVDDGARYLELAHDLADNLRCDVYLTPAGATVRFGHERTAGTEAWEAAAVDAASGLLVDWLVVRPVGLPTTAATWFSTGAGRLRRNHGQVTVALPDGVAFATRASYRETALLAARLLPSIYPLTTVAVNADGGLFEVARFEDAAEPRDEAVGKEKRRRTEQRPSTAVDRLGTGLHGAEFGALVRANVPTIQADVQLALTWPKEAAACATLHLELLALAEELDRTIWVPEPQGSAFLMPGFGEFAAVDEVGSPSRWRAYPPASAVDRTTLFGTDLDGRLAPLGEVAGARFGGVRFVSVPVPQFEQVRHWYSSIAPPPGIFPLDLTVLPDGRLGVMLSHGVAVVAGPRELRELLREAGWRGEDLLLLGQPPAHLWNATIDHARGLVEGLRADLWLATLGAKLWVQADGTIAADGPDGVDQAWCCVAFGRTPNVTLPPALQVPRYTDTTMLLPRPVVTLAALPAAPTPEPYGPYGLDSETPDLTARLGSLPAAPVSPGLPALGTATLGTAAAAPGSPVAALPGPRQSLGRELGSDAPHGVPWLPATPEVNRRTIDLYLWTPHPNDRAEAWTIPAADLFLLAGLDPLRLAERRPGGYLLRLRVPEGASVDLVEHLASAASAVQQRVAETGSTHLLPLAWLSDLRVTARFDLDGTGGVRARTDVRAGELAIRFEGAAHGVPGLPNEVVHWPDKGNRADAPCYLLLPDESRMSLEIVHGGFIALTRRKPILEEGQRLVEVRVRRRRAIDIPATLDTLTGLNVVGRMHDFVGLDLLLPEADLDMAHVTKIWRRGHGNRNSVDKLGGESLYDALLDESILAGPSDQTPALTAV